MKLLHVTIQTNKFEEELIFYLEIVGLKMMRDMRPNGRNMVFLADAEGDSEIEIIENADAECAGNENLSVGFLTADLESKYNELKAKEYEVSPMISPNPHVRFFFVKDPAGVRVQFM